MVGTALFFVFAGLAIACAISMVYHKNPLYSAISLVGVFVSLSCIYVTLAAPFIAAVQILIYAGAIMVLVVFVIMLLNLDDDRTPGRLKYLFALGGGLGAILAGTDIFYFLRGDAGTERTVRSKRDGRQNSESWPGDVYGIPAASRDRRRFAAHGYHRCSHFGEAFEPTPTRIGRENELRN